MNLSLIRFMPKILAFLFIILASKCSIISSDDMLSNSSSTSNKFQRILQDISYNQQGNDWSGLCMTGRLQSPISIDGINGDCNDKSVINFNFVKSPVLTVLKNTNANLTANGFFGTLYATDINKNLLGYDSKYFSIHTPAEHTLNGNQPDLELQIFYTIKHEFNISSLNNNIDTAIVSFLYYKDDTQPTDSFLATLNAANLGTNINVDFLKNLNGKLPTPVQYYSYQGSLTTPPCTENINWYVIDNRFTITSPQLSLFTTYFQRNLSFAGGNGNNRRIESTNNRLIVKGGVQCQDQFVYFVSFFILYLLINYFIFKLL